MRIATLFLIISICQTASAQIVNGTDTLYGNEWMTYGNVYHEFSVWEDGVYRISATQLAELGYTADNAAQLQLFLLGDQIPVRELYAEDGDWVGLEFYGVKNRGELDQQLYLYSSGNEPLNPRYSLYTDTSTYWLTLGVDEGLRYQEIDQPPTGLGLIPYCYRRGEVVYSDEHWKPIHGSDRDYIRYSNFDVCEGFGQRALPNSSTTLATSQRFDNAGLRASLHVRMGSNRGQGGHEQRVLWNDRELEVLNFSGYQVNDLTYTLATGDVRLTNTLRVEGANSSDRHVLAFAELQYPALVDAEGNGTFRFTLDPYSSLRRVRVENWSGTAPTAYDLSSGTVLPTEVTADGVDITIPAKTQQHQYILVNEASSKAPSYEGPYTPEELVNSSADYVILTARQLQGEVMDQYVEYRSSSEGGNHSVVVVDIEDVMAQHGYGVEGHGLALKNFGHYLATQRPSVRSLYIIGKGRSYESYRTEEDRFIDGLQSLVPTYGFPGSDHLITSLGDSPAPRIATGRLAVSTEEELLRYLEKVKTYESAYQLDQTIADKYWTKKILHLSGGSSNGTEQASIANYLLQMEQRVEGNAMGADVTTFYKTTSDDLQTSVSQSILNTIDGGLRLLTFFGHSSQGSFDFSIEDPSKYKNNGRCPLLISLGCYSGDIHTRTGSLSEDFVLEPDKGAIAFLAASGTAYLNQQGTFGNRFYDLLGGQMYGSTIAQIVQKIALENNTVSRNDFAVRTMMQQFTFHGDPALKLVYENGPDYVFDYSSSQTTPEIITTSGAITYSVDIVNLGKSEPSQDSIDLEFVHYLPDGTAYDTARIRTAPVAARTQVDVSLQNPGVNGVGRNTLSGVIDPDMTTVEVPNPAAENNNRLRSTLGQESYEFYILDNSLRPIYPENYSIVNKADFTFAASTANVFQEEETYVIEVDTAATFDSPLLYRETKTVTGGTVEWELPLSWTNNTVYYWRVSPQANSTVTGDYVWQSASFIYLPNSSEGWNQSHYYQWLENVPNGTMRVDSNRQFKLRTDQNYLKVINNTNAYLGDEDLEPEFIGNTFTGFGSAWMWNRSNLREGVHVAVIQGDRDYWINRPPGRAGSVITRGTSVTHSFPTETPSQRRNLISFLLDTVPDGYYLAIYSGQYNRNSSYYVDEWDSDQAVIGTTLFEVFDQLGITGTRILQDRGSVPFIFMCQKGTGEVYRNVIAQTVADEIEAQWEFPRVGQEGTFESAIIGPAQSWDRLIWSEELKDKDSTVIVILGGNSPSAQDFAVIDTVALDYEVDLSMIDPVQHPYLKLIIHSYDDDRSAAQLNYWRVLYTGSPEGTICIDKFQADTLQQGESLRLEHTVKNISSYDLDSLLIQYDIVDTENQRKSQSKRIAPLASGASQKVSFSYNTKALSGDQVLSVELNPDQDQVEAYAFNNVGLKRFYVKEDGRNPDLDVLFDGIRIMSGDYVSAEPEITVYLRDDNPYLPISDTTAFEMRLNSINDPNLSGQVFINDPRVAFEPSTSTDQAATLTFRPSLQDGTYELVVQGRDATGNFSGNNNMALEFRVERQARISNVYNYPNPFSTSTQFIFMLTGQQVPDDLVIQIMTVSGKVVREITREELGPLQIGLNRSQYKWDGRDEYGSTLGNGVYLYRVFSSQDTGEDILHYDTDGDSLFKEGFGKMVIMR